MGTKYIVEDYIKTICEALRFVLNYEQNSGGSKQKTVEEDQEGKEKEKQDKIGSAREGEGGGGGEGEGGSEGQESERTRKRPLTPRHRSNSGGFLPRHHHYRLDDGSGNVTLTQKLYFFKETRHSLGRSALLLSGGITLVGLILIPTFRNNVAHNAHNIQTTPQHPQHPNTKLIKHHNNTTTTPAPHSLHKVKGC